MLALRAYSNSAAPVLDDVAPPKLGPTEVRIEVAAAAVNPVDVMIASGRLRQVVPLPDPSGLGWDVSGTVIELGDEVADFSVGDRVAGLLQLLALKPDIGTHADEAVLSAAAIARVPAGLDLVEAASLPLNAVSARQALDLLGPAVGRTLLVTGGAGALGGHVVALASRSGWRVTALARESDRDLLTRNGADLITELPGPSFDAVVDAAVLLESALSAVRDEGSFVGVAPASPVLPERGIETQTLISEPDGAVLADLLRQAAAGSLEVRIAGRVPLEEAERAFDEVAHSGQRGRWLLVP